ncbi:hypothetical protein BSL78_27496 [Apostichopus japonicus]|uniref:Uncharacterized protein n=1 Tax=Stichopus japonicus TaxID=307972 RepID=A0A2G8JIY0_STIJA|nr:hypothetical protein BSL78_27496 [Apostichopus japonicus]
MEVPSRALRHFECHLRGYAVTAFCDDTTVVAIVNRQGDEIPITVPAMWTFCSGAGQRHLSKTSHIAGRENVTADALSKGAQTPVDPAGSHLFASTTNAKSPVFCMRTFYHQSVGRWTHSRSAGRGLRRTPPPLPHTQGASQTEPILDKATTYRALLTEKTVVPDPSRSSSWNPMQSSGQTQLSELGSSPSQSTSPTVQEPECVAVFRSRFRASGFSPDAAAIAASARRQATSTLTILDWHVFFSKKKRSPDRSGYYLSCTICGPFHAPLR